MERRKKRRIIGGKRRMEKGEREGERQRKR